MLVSVNWHPNTVDSPVLSLHRIMVIDLDRAVSTPTVIGVT